MGLPGDTVGRNLPAYARGHGFDVGSRNSPHAADQLSSCTTATEPLLQSPGTATTEPRFYNYLKPVLLGSCARLQEKPEHCNKKPLTQLEKAHVKQKGPAPAKKKKREREVDYPGGSVVKNLHCKARDTVQSLVPEKDARNLQSN